jgi:tRNA 2-thiouridine synthesizing protein A
MMPTHRDKDLPAVDAVLEVYTTETGGMSACAVLTPMIKSRLREMQGGQILEIRVDDPSARVDVPAWSRLTGHELVAVVDEDERRTRFYLRKKMD